MSNGMSNDGLDLIFRKARTHNAWLGNLGYGDASKLHPRSPRLDFGEACKLV